MEELPELPPEIKEAYINNTLCLFIGAGISRLAGCPGWRDLCDNILKDPEVTINNSFKEILLKESDNKKLLTTIFELFEEKDEKEKKFFEIIKKHLQSKEEAKRKEKEEKPRIYEILEKLEYALKVTTNADSVIDKYLGNKKIIYENFKEELLPLPCYSWTKRYQQIKPLFKIHGTVEPDNKNQDFDQLIFTIPSYLKRYKRLEFQEFLKQLFSRYTVLFIGYGMSEFELLQYALPEKTKQKRFILQGYYSFQEIQEKIDEQYYKVLGIDLCPFNYDQKFHHQLTDILDKWSRELVGTHHSSVQGLPIDQKSAFIRDRIKDPKISPEQINNILGGLIL